MGSIRDEMLQKYTQKEEEEKKQSASSPTTPTSGAGKTGTSSIREQLKSKYVRIGNTDDVDEDFIKTFQSDVTSYFDRAKASYSGLNYTNAADTYESQYKDIDDLLTRSRSIQQYLRNNRTSFDKEYYDSMNTDLASINKALAQYSSAFYEARHNISQFESEEAYNAAKQQSDWQKEYGWRSKENLKGILEDMEDGDEKNWLSGFVSQLEYEEMSKFDIAAGEKEISSLEAMLQEYKGLTRWMTDEKGQARAAAIRKQYGGEEEIKALINEKKQYLNQAKRIQDGITLSGVVDNYDFKASSGYSTTIKENPSWGGSGNGDTQYEWINNQNGFRDDYEQQMVELALESGYEVKESYYYEKGYDLMTESEIAIYNYHYSKEGREKAQEYLNSIQETLNQRKATGMYEGMEGNTAMELIFGMVAGLDQFESGLMGLARAIAGNDSYTPVSATQMASGMIREDLADDGFKLPDWLGGASIGQAAYDAVTTTANMAPSILTSIGMNLIVPGSGAVVGTAMMGGSAAGNAYQEVINQGWDKDQAQAYAALVGGSEAALGYLLGGISSLGGKVSGGAVSKLLNNVDNAVARTAIKLGGNMLSEGFEEGLQEILTPWFESILTGADYEVSSADVLYSSLLGALTAGFMEGGNTISGEVGTYRTGRQLQDAGVTAKSLSEMGNKFSADTVAHQLAGRVNENTGAYTMGRLFNEIGAEVTEQNKSDIVRSLERKGVRNSDAQKIASVLADVVTDPDSVTKATAMLLEANDDLAQTIHDVIINPNSTVNQRSKGYKETLMALAKEKSGASASDASRMNPAEAGAEIESAEGNLTTPSKTATEDGQEASVEGKTIRNSDGKAVSIQQITSIKDGKMTFRLDDGSEVSSADVTYGNADEALIYETVSGMGASVQSANILVDGFKNAQRNSGLSASVYAHGIQEAFRYGEMGIPMRELARSPFASKLTIAQQDYVYRQGKKAAGRKVAKAQATVKKSLQVANKNATVAKNVGKVHFDGDRSNLTERQSTSLSAMEKVADALGVQIYVFESQVDENGKRIGANGWYDPKDSSIHIDLYAGASGESTMLFTAAHELVHFIKQWSPAKFKTLANFLMKEYGQFGAEYGQNGVSVEALVQRQIEKAERSGRTLSYDEAYEEVIADSMETMLADGNVVEKLAKLKQQDKGLWQKVKDFISELAAKIRSVYDGLTPDSAEGRYVADMVDSIEKLQELFVEGLVEASENYESSLTPGEESVMVNQNGDPVAYNTEDGSVMLSMRTYEEEGRTAFRNYLQKCVTNKSLTKAEMQEMMDGIEDIYQTCKEFKDKYAPFSTWSDAAVVRDTYGKPVFSVVTPNGDYKMNLDFSLVCKKRRTLDAVFNEMSRRGIIDDFELGQKSVVKINEIIRRHGLETACALCFVDAKRFRQASMADQFTNLYNELVLSLVPEDQRGSIDHFNFSGYATIKKVDGGIDTWANAKLDFSHLDEVMKNYGKGTVEHKSAKYIKSHPEGRKLLLRGDFMSSQGFDAVKTQNKDILKLYNSKKGTGGPKAAFGDVQYLNEVIKKARTWTPAKAYAVGGVRIQSFSDYVPRMVFDYTQMIYDLAATKLPAHAYTKEALFVKQFGLTGVKINMSLIPAIAEGGIAPGLDANGNYVWAGESFDYETAKEIQNAEGYTENCGTICVGVSYEHIQKLLRDPNIRMVIPYHKSGLNPIVAHMNKIAEFTDYTNDQRTKGKDGKALSKDFDFSKALHDMGDKASPKAVADQYLKWCVANGYTARFAEFAAEDNYYKLLEDFTLYDKDGNYVPQREVRAVFPKADSAFGSMKDLIQEGLQEDAVVEGKRDSSLNSIVDEIQNTLPRTEAEISETQVEQADRDLEAIEVFHSDIKYSERVTDKKTLDFLNKQKTITTYKTMQIVDGKLYPPMAARTNGAYEDYSELGAWEQATEHPELIKNGNKYKLDKGKGQGSIEAAYNPYMHSSNLVLNDQFSGAYTRDNLVTVECEVPVSELTSGYHAQYAKDSVGWHAWHTGTVAGSLRKSRGIERQVFLSRWIKPVRIVPDSEVASMYRDLLDGTGIAVPDNVVTPSLLKELKNAGVKIKESGRVKYSSRDFTYQELTAKSDLKGRSIRANRTVKLTKNGSIDRAWIVSEVLRQCQSIKTKAPAPTYFVNVPDIGKNVEITSNGIKHGFIKFEAKNGKPVPPKALLNARVSLDLPQILQNSIEVNQSDRGDNAEVEFSHILIGVTALEDINGNVEYYAVRSVVEARKNQGAILTEANVIGKLHAMNAKKIRKPQAQVSGNNTALASSFLFDYSVANLLNDVKNEFDDTFSNDVYKHFGMTRNANRFSQYLKYSDRDYMDAVNSGDMETAQKMVDEAAKAAGYTIEAYHGTNADFTVFDKNMQGKGIDKYGSGFYFANHKDLTEPYGKKTYSTYLKIQNPIRIRSTTKGEDLYDVRVNKTQAYKILKKHPLMYDKESSPLGDFYEQYWEVGPKEWMVRDMASKYNSLGLLDGDPAAFKNYPNELHEAVREVMGYDGVQVWFDHDEFYTERYDYFYVAWFDNQMKSSEPVVRDDNGNVIPLSERFNESRNDIRYSDRDTESVSNRSLLANALESAAMNDIERKRIQEYKGKIDLINAEERKLQDLNQQIKDLSFAKGPKDTKAIRDLQFEAKQTANRISVYDKQLLRLEASKPLQDVLDREKKAAYKRAEQKGKQALEAYREKAAKTQRALIDRYQESRKKGIESREKTAMRHKIKDVVNELNQYLLHGDKEKRVMMPLKKAVAEALDAVNMDTVGAEERIAKLQAELMKAKTPEKIQEISRKIDHIQQMGDRMSSRLKALKDAYREIAESDDPLIANAHDDVIEAKLESVIEKVGDTPLRDMNLEQLGEVYDMYRMVLTTIRNSNKAFKQAKNESIATLGNQVMEEVEKVGGKKKYNLSAVEAIKKFGWNNLKPVYAFEHIGSSTLKRIFNSVRAGEDVWAKDVTEARAFYLEKSKKYGFDSWKMDQWHEFTSTSGMGFSLNLEQIMSLYAYSKRDQAADHLRRGGIVIDETTEITMKTKLGLKVKFNPTEATAYNISDETLADIISKLTDEQKQFVDEMQEYLSTTMGNKGNEVSLELYGIKLFKEKFYFPLKSASQFMAKAKEQQQGEVKIKNSGFSKETVKKASNPIVLTPFMNVWANHVNEMSMYHAFVLPMEDFYRVYNYRTPTHDSMATESVEMFIQNAYGKGATRYIDQLLKDLNGGARTDSTTGIINKGMGLFKKGAVFASASVVIQQPSAIARAAAIVDLKYFIGRKVDIKRHKALWDEVKQYAPVAIIKEMGYFDTNMGMSTQDFILSKEYSSISEKAKALFTDSNYRDEILSKAPALADELAWCSIWEAVKRETKAKNPGMDVSSDAFLQKAGERFTEVITKTQVYDSVLSRSANMRSKDTGMKMATAFMAEPTTAINMVSDALLKGKRDGLEGRRFCRKAIGAVVAAQILNAFLVSWVYAARDDDEDETYAEKWISQFLSGTIDGLNPLTYIPFIKDIISIVQGYDVERSDMAVISDLWHAWQQLQKDDVSAWRKVEGFAGSIFQIFGLPVKNIMRDLRATWQAYDTILNGEKTTKAGIVYAIKEAVTGKSTSNMEQLYEARMAGDEEHEARVEGRYGDEDSANAAVRAAIKERFMADEIDAVTARNQMIEYSGMDVTEAHWLMDAWVYRKNKGSDDGYSKYGRFYDAVRTGKDLKAVVKEYTDNGVKTATLVGQITEQFKPEYVEMSASDRAALKGYLANAYVLLGLEREDAMEKLASWDFEAEYGFAYSDRKQAYLNGQVSEETLIKILVGRGYTAEDAAAQVEAYEWDAMGIEGVTTDAISDYNTWCEPVGISKEVYMAFRKFDNSTENDVDEATGKKIAYSAVKKIMAYINDLDLTNEQKDALAKSAGWADKTIRKYKLW